MATVTKRFLFDTDLQGWTTNGYTNSVLKWGSESIAGSGSGVPGSGNTNGFMWAYAGSGASTSGSNPGPTPTPSGVVVAPNAPRPMRADSSTVENPYFEYSGTWQNLGVPADTVVNSIRLDSGYDRSDVYSSGVVVGPYVLYQGGNLQATLKPSRTPTGNESWTAFGSQGDQAVPSSISSINTTVQLRFYCNLPTTTASSVKSDQLSYVITYSTSKYQGSLAASIHPAFTGSATRSLQTFRGSCSLSVSKTASFSGSVGPKANIITKGWGYSQRVIRRGYYTLTVNYQGAITASIHPNFIASGSRSAPIFSGTAVLARGATFSSNGTRATPTYNGSLTGVSTATTAVFSGNVKMFAYSGSMTVAKSSMITISTNSLPVYYGSANLTSSNKVFSANAKFIAVRNGSVNLSRKPSFAASGTFYTLNYKGTTSLYVNHPTVSFTGRYSIVLSNKVIKINMFVSDDVYAFPVTVYDSGPCRQNPTF